MLNTLKTNVIMYLCSGLKNRKAAGADGIPPEALKAVDSVDRSTIWKLMEHYRIPSSSIALLETCMTMPHVT